MQDPGLLRPPRSREEPMNNVQKPPGFAAFLEPLSFGLFLVLFLLPAPYFAGVDLSALCVMRGLCGATLALTLLHCRLTRSSFITREDMRFVKWPLVLFCFFLLY